MIEDITLDLNSLLAYDAILLQCHDNPDPDTISSAFALSCFFFAHGVPTMIFYGGFREISKPNIIRMIDALRIHIRFVGTDITRAQELCPQAIQREAFDKCYVPVHERFVYKPPNAKGSFYSPTIRESLYGKQLELLPHVRACHPREDIIFWAKRLTRRTKLFTPWYPEGYIAGDIGDYLTIRVKDSHDVLIEKPEVFASIFELDEA